MHKLNISKFLRHKQNYVLTHVDKWTFELKIFFGVDQSQHFAWRRAVITESFKIVRYDFHRGYSQCRRLMAERHGRQTAQFTTLNLTMRKSCMRLQTCSAELRGERALRGYS